MYRRVTVAEFKLALYEHAQSYIEGYREESADENKKSPPDDADGETLISASEGDNETSYQDTATVDSTLGSGGGVESAIGDGTKGGADTVGDTSAMEEDFSETVLPAVAIKRISAEELEAVIEEMEGLYDKLKNGLVGGVYSGVYWSECYTLDSLLQRT